MPPASKSADGVMMAQYVSIRVPSPFVRWHRCGWPSTARPIRAAMQGPVWPRVASTGRGSVGSGCVWPMAQRESRVPLPRSVVGSPRTVAPPAGHVNRWCTAKFSDGRRALRYRLTSWGDSDHDDESSSSVGRTCGVVAFVTMPDDFREVVTTTAGAAGSATTVSVSAATKKVAFPVEFERHG